MPSKPRTLAGILRLRRHANRAHNLVQRDPATARIHGSARGQATRAEVLRVAGRGVAEATRGRARVVVDWMAMRPALRTAVYRVFIAGIAVGLALSGTVLWLRGDRESGLLALRGFGLIVLGLGVSVWVAERRCTRDKRRD